MGRKWAINNPDAYRRLCRRGNWKRYGIDPDKAEALLAKATSCDICKIKEVSLQIDHCHVTGKIRGVLCHKCNTALGLFEDNTTYINQALHYLGYEDAA